MAAPRLSFRTTASAWKQHPLLKKQLRDMAQEVMKELNEASFSADVLLTDACEMQRLNSQWRGKDKPTNVLSFPSPPQLVTTHRMMGSIALGYEVVKQEAMDEAKSFEHHAAHLLTHGLLHLFGFDHETDEEAQEMETTEIAILHKCGIPNPYKDRIERP